MCTRLLLTTGNKSLNQLSTTRTVVRTYVSDQRHELSRSKIHSKACIFPNQDEVFDVVTRARNLNRVAQIKLVTGTVQSDNTMVNR